MTRPALSLLFALAAASLLSTSATAQTLDAFEGFVSVNGTFFDSDLDVPTLDAFDGQTFSIAAGEPLELAGDVKTQPGGGATEGADAVQLQWKIFETPNPLAFNQQAYGFSGNPSAGVDQWDALSTVNVAAGLSPGVYTLEIFWSATDFAFGGQGFVNNGGSNYSATVEIVPEPTGVALGIVALGAVALRRRAR